MNPALFTAFGNRGVAKLVQSLSDPAESADLAQNLATLNGLLSNQESKVQALANDGAVVAVLTGLLGSDEVETRRQAGLALGSLTLLFQGRLAAADAGTVAALARGLLDREESVRAACSSALLSLSESRDGCSVLMQADAEIPQSLTRALDDEGAAAVSSSLGALANLLRLDLGVEEAIATGAVGRLAKLLDPKLERERKAPLELALQAVWNLANTPAGKSAAIEAGMLAMLSVHVSSSYSAEIRRLASGCIMAITIDKEGKLRSVPCAEPVASLLFHPESDPSTIRDAVGALKNMSEYPKVRRVVDRYAREQGVESVMTEMFSKPMYDHKQWPASLRYQHQNVAPGGAAAETEAQVRERWGYPAPFNS